MHKYRITNIDKLSDTVTSQFALGVALAYMGTDVRVFLCDGDKMTVQLDAKLVIWEPASRQSNSALQRQIDHWIREGVIFSIDSNISAEEIASAYLEICDQGMCGGDDSVGIPKCQFYEFPDVITDGNGATTGFIKGGCRLKEFLKK